jgi:hypothetical protein
MFVILDYCKPLHMVQPWTDSEKYSANYSSFYIKRNILSHLLKIIFVPKFTALKMEVCHFLALFM